MSWFKQDSEPDSLVPNTGRPSGSRQEEKSPGKYDKNGLPGLDWSSLPELVHPLGGHLPEKRLLKKCQQLENLAQPVVEIVKGRIIWK